MNRREAVIPEESADDARYARIAALGWQRSILAKLKLIVVGAGALGNEVIKNLALLGVGKVLIVDMDAIESSNLTRSVLYRLHDIGRMKAEVAAESAMEIDPNLKAIPVCKEVQASVGLGSFRRADFVFGCLDNTQTRRDVNRFCLQTQTPFIDAGLHALSGDVRVYLPPFEVCLDCRLNNKKRMQAWQRFSCLKLRDRNQDGKSIPTAPTISSIMAGLQVQLAMKYLHGSEIPNYCRVTYHGDIDEFNTFDLSRAENCPTHFLYENDIISDDNVVELNENSADLTGEELLAIVRQYLSENAEVDLGFDLIPEARCNICGTTTPLFKQRGMVYKDEAECPTCLAAGRSGVNVIRKLEFINLLTGKENFLHLPLAKIGIPPLHILKGIAYNEETDEIRTLYFELTKDAQEVWSE